MELTDQVARPANQRQPELDYLRGLACLMVVAFHYLYRGPKAGWTGAASYPWAEAIASHGHLGVQLFFMISGYVIYKSATGRTTVEFAKARFWRLYRKRSIKHTLLKPSIP